MASRTNKSVVPALHKWLGTIETGGLSDGWLLQRFVVEHDQDAFATLVRRHGPLVYHAARRVLTDQHEAEDVLQATFLVLARRAGALERRPSLANWLYTVAIRLARKVCAGRRRRLVLEQRQETAQPRDPLA